jgi:pyridoxine 5-phosphate synthase
MDNPTALSVNLNKVAVLRNSRGGDEPDLLRAAKVCIGAGCQGITVHPRSDRRHIRPEDVVALRRLCDGLVELNIEGNPFSAPRAGYPGFLPVVLGSPPDQCTLVPDGDGQLTSDHGFIPRRDAERLAPVVATLKAEGIRVSVFIDPGTRDLQALARIGVDRIELYTGPFAAAHAAGADSGELERCRITRDEAFACGLAVNAGHDLAQGNLGDFLSAVAGISEVSIGHALIGEALYLGLAPTVAAYLRIIAESGSRGRSPMPVPGTVARRAG